MAKNGAGYDPDVEDVPNDFGNEEEGNSPICDACGMPVFENEDIYNLTGLCGACATGEAEMLG